MVNFRDLHFDAPNKEDSPAPSGGNDTLADDLKFSGPAPVTENPSGSPADSAENRPNLHEQASLYLHAVFAEVREKKPFSIPDGYRLMHQMVESRPSQDTLFIMAFHQNSSHNYVINHSVNVAIFAMTMGAHLGFGKEEQIEIGMAGLLHDVGTALIPDSIINKKDKLSDKEFKIIQERPKHSYRLIKACGERYHHLAEIAMQVYEKVDGSGYPHRLKGDEIHEFAQILGLVDMYEALTHDRPQREKLSFFSAVKEIIQSSKNAFQRKHLKMLLSIFSIFPIYSYVRLNSDAIGKVVETFPDQPMRPRLQIIYDSQKRRVLTERIINLPENPLLYIVDSVSEQELEALAGI